MICPRSDEVRGRTRKKGPEGDRQGIALQTDIFQLQRKIFKCIYWHRLEETAEHFCLFPVYSKRLEKIGEKMLDINLLVLNS